MFTVTDAVTGNCPLCTKQKERPLFVVRSETYNGRACADHLHSLIRQTKPQQEPAPAGNGQPAGQH